MTLLNLTRIMSLDHFLKAFEYARNEIKLEHFLDVYERLNTLKYFVIPSSDYLPKFGENFAWKGPKIPKINIFQIRFEFFGRKNSPSTQIIILNLFVSLRTESNTQNKSSSKRLNAIRFVDFCQNYSEMVNRPFLKGRPLNTPETKLSKNIF